MRVAPSIFVFSSIYFILSFGVVFAQSDTDTSIPEIYSPSYSNTNQWYSNPNGYFEWEVPFDTLHIATGLSTTTNFEPTDTHDADKNRLYFSEYEPREGLQYVSVQFRNPSGWGNVAFYPVLIDTQPPQSFSIKVDKDGSGFPNLHFQTSDSLSGIDYYEVYVPHERIIRLTPEQALEGLVLTNLEDNIYIIKVEAYDKAGNKRESQVSVVVNAGWNPEKEDKSINSWLKFFEGENAIIFILTLVIFGQFLYILYEKQQLRLEEEIIKKETKDAQDQMIKIFSALRAEIFEQINLISQKKKVTKAEKNAIEGLNEALKVSEKLLKKEIKDIKDILK